jgi:hypothetical protein
VGTWTGADQQNDFARHGVRLDGNATIPSFNTHPRILPNTTLPMRFFNKSKPSIEVEVVSLDAKLRVGETKWDAVVYRRVDDGQIHCRPKVEFFAKFVLIAKK